MLMTASTVSMLRNLGQLIWVLVLFVLVLLLTLLTTRWIAKYQQGQLHNPVSYTHLTLPTKLEV